MVHNKTIGAGYDLMKSADVEKMLLEIEEQAPWKTWFSPACVLPATEPASPAAVREKQMKAKYQLDNVSRLTEGILKGGGHRHVYLEMPSTSTSWGTAAARKFKTLLGQHGSMFRTLIDGCMVGMSSGTGIPIKKQFTVIHNDREFHEKMHVVCDRSHGHWELERLDPHTEMFVNHAVYPERMTENVARLWKSQYMKYMAPRK